jgi:tRNA dimethylallyltransferase
MKPKLVIVLGPTGVGKSDVALELAEQVGAEIVNADSQQVYRYMDIGTAKASDAERARVRHHVIDVVDPDEDFNAALFRRLATEAIERIRGRGKNVIVCGGTGLYLKVLTRGLFSGPAQDPEIRRSLEQEIKERGQGALYRRLAAIDPAVTSTIHPHDRQRIIRALEVFALTGRPLGAWQKAHRFEEEPFDLVKIGLVRERAELYDRINRRSDRMIDQGLLEEVRELVSRGFGLGLKSLRSVGYRQIGAVISGQLALPQAVEAMKQETRRLAKRQLTWFRHERDIRWHHPERERREILETVAEFLRWGRSDD